MPTSDKKDTALQYHRDLLLATIDYLRSRWVGAIILDEEDGFALFFEHQKQQAERHYNERRLDRLEQQLASLIKMAQREADPGFTAWIKEKTGYDLDIFEDLRRSVEVIVAQKEIRNRKELHQVDLMHDYYQKIPDKKVADELLQLTIDYHNKEEAAKAASGKKTVQHSQVIKREIIDGEEYVTEIVFFGPKPKLYEEEEVISPDGKRKLRIIREALVKREWTIIEIKFEVAVGVFFQADSIRRDVKASWKDNATILVETAKDCHANTRARQIRRLDEVIKIEYIESNQF